MTELISLEKIAQWQKLKTLVLDSVSSPITKRVYNMVLEEFMGWFQLVQSTQKNRQLFIQCEIACLASAASLESSMIEILPYDLGCVLSRRIDFVVLQNWHHRCDLLEAFWRDQVVRDQLLCSFVITQTKKRDRITK